MGYSPGRQQKVPCLFFDDSQCGVRNTQNDRSPGLFACGGHQILYGTIYDVHTWGQNTGEPGQWDSVQEVLWLVLFSIN